MKNADRVWFGVAYEDHLAKATTFGNSEGEVVKALLKMHPLEEPLKMSFERSVFADSIVRSMINVYEGKGSATNNSLDLERLRTYTRRVLRTVSQIPLGYVVSYGGVAEVAGGGARAVGNVMATNPFAPIIPCHRVVTSSLGLGGYGGGLKTKFEILQREKQGYVKSETLQIGARSLKVFPVEFVLAKLKYILKF